MRLLIVLVLAACLQQCIGVVAPSTAPVSIAKSDQSLVVTANTLVVEHGVASAALGPLMLRIGSVSIDEADLASIIAMADTANALEAQVAALRLRLDGTCGCSACASTPCLNSGTCTTDAVGGAVCVCADAYTGDHCETERDECASMPCQNGASCMDMFGGFVCLCSAGFTGDLCDEIAECDSSPCQNGAVCHDGFMSYTCTCPVGTTGFNCESVIDCAAACLNGGTCYEIASSDFACVCAAPYTGSQCESVVAECTSNPCLVDQTCYESPTSGYYCDSPCPSVPPVVGTCDFLPGNYTGVSTETQFVTLVIGPYTTDYTWPGYPGSPQPDETLVTVDMQCEGSRTLDEAVAFNDYFNVDATILSPTRATGAVARSRVRMISPTDMELISTLPFVCERYTESTAASASQYAERVFLKLE